MTKPKTLAEAVKACGGSVRQSVLNKGVLYVRFQDGSQPLFFGLEDYEVVGSPLSQDDYWPSGRYGYRMRPITRKPHEPDPS